MRVKGNRVTNAAVRINYVGTKKLSDDKIVERGDRNSVTVQTNEAKDEKDEIITFNAGPQWSEVKKEFTVRFDVKDLADLTQVTNWQTVMMFSLSPGDGNLYVDDVKIVEKQ